MDWWKVPAKIRALSLPKIGAADQDGWLFSSIKHPVSETQGCLWLVWQEFKPTGKKPGGRRWQSCRALSMSSDSPSTTSKSMSPFTFSPSTQPLFTVLLTPLATTSHSMADTAHANNKHRKRDTQRERGGEMKGFRICDNSGYFYFRFVKNDYFRNPWRLKISITVKINRP